MTERALADFAGSHPSFEGSIQRTSAPGERRWYATTNARPGRRRRPWSKVCRTFRASWHDVTRALQAGATDADTQLAVLIASAFCMYNRMVDGLRARTPASADAYVARATEIAEYGYGDPRVTSIPR